MNRFLFSLLDVLPDENLLELLTPIPSTGARRSHKNVFENSSNENSRWDDFFLNVFVLSLESEILVDENKFLCAQKFQPQATSTRFSNFFLKCSFSSPIFHVTRLGYLLQNVLTFRCDAEDSSQFPF